MKTSTNTTTHSYNDSTSSTVNFDNKTTSIVSHKSAPFSKLFTLVLIGLLVFALIRITLGLEPIYFSSFLEGLTKVPTVTFNTFESLTIGGNWGLFDAFRVFLNYFTGLLSLLIYIAGGLLSLLNYLLYFVSFLFGF